MSRPVEQDDEEDERPRRQKRRDDDDDDRPRRKKKNTSKSGSSGLIIVGAIIGVLVLVGGGVGIYFATKKKAKAEPDVVEQPAPNPARVNQPIPNSNSPEIPVLPGPGKSRSGSVAIPSTNPFVDRVRFGGGEDGYAAILVNRATISNIDVVNTATGDVAGQIALSQMSPLDFAVSPDGKWLAVIESTGSGGNGYAVALYTVGDGKQATKFTPYLRTAANLSVPNLIWVNFISKDHFLTINAAGGLDTWSVPEFKRTGSVPGKLTGGNTIQVNPTNNCPANFTVTPDGKTLAAFNGGGFTFYNTQALAETGKTEAMAKGLPPRVIAAALSPDGGRLASCYTSPETGGNSLTVWDSKTGQKLSTALLDRGVFLTGGAVWWGPNHLVGWGPGPGAYALEVGSGKIAATLQVQTPGKYGTISPNGQLWYITGETLVKPATGAAFLIRADAPSAITPGVKYQLTTEGLLVK